MRFWRSTHWIVVFLAVTGTAYAEVSVEEADGSSSSSTSTNAMSVEQRVQKLERQMQNQANLLKQIDTANQQIKDLQGQLEVQGHDIKLLQEQQKSQYSDLDLRLNNLSHKDVERSESSPDKKSEPVEKTTTKTTCSTKPTDDKAQKAYQTAYAFLKNKNYDKAKTAFQKFIHSYPDDANTVDAHYWLGNIYLLKNQPDNAIAQFKIAIKLDKRHAKTADTLFKLGLAYSIQGDLNQARIQFRKVKQNYPGTQAAKLASEKLK